MQHEIDINSIILKIRLLVADLLGTGIDYETLESVIFGPLQDSKAYLVRKGNFHGNYIVPEANAEISLNPTESTIYRLFLAHPEGLSSGCIHLYQKEIRAIYREETRYDEPRRIEEKISSICSESKTVFYPAISRIKRKFTQALGSRKAEKYIIKRDASGLYRTSAILNASDHS